MRLFSFIDLPDVLTKYKKGDTSCQKIESNPLIKINERKQYVLASLNFKKTLPYQTEAFRFKAKFIRKILNLLVIS